MPEANERQLRIKLWLVLSVALSLIGCVAIFGIARLAFVNGSSMPAGGILTVAAVVVALCLMLALVVTWFFLPGQVFEHFARTLKGRRMLKGSFVELLFIGVVALVVASAAIGLAMQDSAETSAKEALKRIRSLELLRSQLVNAMAAGGADSSGTSQLSALSRSAGVPWVPTSERASTRELLSVAKITEIEIAKESDTFGTLEHAMGKKNQGLLAIFGLSLFLSLGAVILIRMARRQETELQEAREVAARQAAAYQQIADNLPIGFYTYAGGRIETSNVAWDRLVCREESEDRRGAFERTLHSEDCQRVMETLAKAEQERTAFGLAYKIALPDGNIRHVETRGVSVHDWEGGPEYIVGFLVDISSRVRAQRLLEDKNREVEATNDRLRGALAEIESNFEAMVQSLVKAVEAKDPYTAGHSERVMEYSLKIGERMGLSEEELRVLKMGCLVHDIGKIGIPDAILTKPSRLTEEEYELIKMHPLLGYRMIERIPTFAECLPIVLHHHERLDGGGYPHGLKGLDIPLMVRVCTVADCFDAMTSDRAYRKGLDPFVAVDELYKDADRKVLDRGIVGVLAEIVEEEGIISSATSATAA
ncbi:MAG TPA: HD domain-containing phosphohydrolase [Fimbriimonas sp.]|nr:HD domain-containing phosphohydrolase [Fimbriimonas sp.]